MVSKSSFYDNLYYRLCESRKTLVSVYGRGSGLHEHHIVPRHSGGTDDPSNFTYLTVREHVIAHWLLWKIHHNPNDLRSMRMLGAELSVEHRQIIGKFCFENKIGMHGMSREERQEIGSRNGIKARNEQYGIHDPAFEIEYRRNAGRVSGIKSFETKTNLFAPEHAEKRKNAASQGGRL